MLIVGELINTSRKDIYDAVLRQDGSYIQGIAKYQADAGAHYLDVKCDTFIDREKEIMLWLIEHIQKAVRLPLCLDTESLDVMKESLKNIRWGIPMINAITAESEFYPSKVALALNYQAKIIARCIDDHGIPKSVMERMVIAGTLINRLNSIGVVDDDIYVDPFVKSISVCDQEGLAVINVVRMIGQQYPKVHKICGLSNISYGMPCRSFLNSLFLAQVLASGMDCFILNPLDRNIRAALCGAQALTGHDPGCTSYIKCCERKGSLDIQH